MQTSRKNNFENAEENFKNTYINLIDDKTSLQEKKKFKVKLDIEIINNINILSRNLEEYVGNRNR